jgi:2,3-bisphosphoglycerate-independent phosphoglycerate mutase
VQDLVDRMAEIGAGRVATVCGRYWAMDRDKRWDRVARAWSMLVDGKVDEKGVTATDPVAAIAASYSAGVTDEFVEPTIITGQDSTPTATIRDGDSVFFWNFRADRARELTWAFMQKDFAGFPMEHRPRVNYLCMTPYDQTLDLPVMFTPEMPRNGLAEVFAARGIRNLRTAETEKYAHVTYFFNGGREEPFPYEERKLIPSPKVATYDLQPEMSAPEVAAVVREACEGTRFDVVIVNFANGDMVGHTGVYEAAVKAFRTLNDLLEEIMPASIARGTTWLVTADHGNCDEMLTPDGKVLTQHSLNRVPFVVAGREFENRPGLVKEGDFGLSDIAPTILRLLDIPQPPEMTGRCIIDK